MHQLVDEYLDKAGSPYFSPIQKDLYLNKAQNEFIDDRYAMFEQNEMYKQDLRPLVKTFTNSGSSVINLDSITDFRYALAVSGVFTRTDCNGATSTFDTYVQPRILDDYFKNKNNTFNKATSQYPVYIQYNNGTNNIISVDTGGSTPVSLQMFYLKIPTAIDGTDTGTQNNSPDLPENTHEKIVTLCVRKMLGVIESTRVQDQMLEQSQQK